MTYILPSHHSASVLQWLPYNWWQLVYIALRWMVALYFLGWLIYVFVAAREPKSKLLIFLTIWGFIVWTLYLLVAAMSSTVKMGFWIWNTALGEREPELDPADHLQSVVVTWSEDRVAWYQKVHWVLFILGVPVQICVMLLYWTLLSGMDANRESAENYNLHLLGGLIGLIDVFVSGVILSLYHLYLVIGYGCVYTVFTGIYYAANGTNPRGDRYIYPILDYGNNPGTSAAVGIATSLVVVPLIYLLTYGISVVRRWLAHWFQLWLYRNHHPTRRSDSHKELEHMSLEEDKMHDE